MDGRARQRGDPAENETIPWGGTNDKDMLGFRAASAASVKSDPNYGGCNKEGSIPSSLNHESKYPPSPYRGDSKMTGKLARLMVGTCMTAALTVSGLAGSMPAAHATGGGSPTCNVAFSGITVDCTEINTLNHLVTISVTDNNVNILTVKDVLNNNWVLIPIASGNAVEIETAVKDVLSHNNILSCLINVTIVAQDSKNGNCG
jgi:hypothetical protein